MNGYGLDTDIIIARERGNEKVQENIRKSWHDKVPVMIWIS
jgi:hypothetical protein